MKKKFKIALLSLLILPCVLLTACAKSISASDYYVKSNTAANNYYNKVDDHESITTTVETTEVDTRTKFIEYNNGDSATTADFETTTTTKTTYEIVNTKIADSLHTLIRVTKNSTKVEKGSEANAEDTGIVEFTKTTVTNEVITLTYEEETYKAYHAKDVKVNDKTDETNSFKTIYTYLNLNLYETSIKSFDNNVLYGLVNLVFFTIPESIQEDSGSSLEYYKDGKTEFGVEFDYAKASAVAGKTSLTQTSGKVVFDNDLPSNATINNSLTRNIEDLDDDHSDFQIHTSSESKITVSYADITIDIPTGFEEATTALTPPSFA